MARVPLSRLSDWELVDPAQDLHGRKLLDTNGRPLGTISEMIVDTETEFVDWVLLDNGAEYAVHSIQIRDGRVVLEPLPWTDEAMPAEVPAQAVAEPDAAPAEAMPRPIESRQPPPDPDAIEWVRRRVAVGPSAADAAATPTVGPVFELREDELRTATQPVEIGEVRVGKEIVAEPRTIEVPVSREVVVIEHFPVARRPADPIGAGETLRLVVRAEQVEVEQVPRVAEEVTIGKREVETTTPVTETVRREALAVERQGDAVVRAAGEE